MLLSTIKVFKEEKNMVSLFFIISLGITIFFFVRDIKERNRKKYDDQDQFLATFISSCFPFVFLIWGLLLIYDVGTGYIIDNKIEMYEEENKHIEESIDIAVKSHMNYESSTYGELKHGINTVLLIPELKSDKLVQKQIEVYVNNRDKIKELKEKKIELSEKKWLLYFGK